MYYYANVNLTRGCWICFLGGGWFCFVFFQKKSKCGHPSSILYPEFVTMHFLKGGRQGKKPVCVLMYSSFCVHGFPMSGKGRKEEEKALARSAELGWEGPLRPHPRAGLIAKQNWGRGLPCLSIIMVQDSWYWPCSVNLRQLWKLTGSSILWTQNPFKLRKPCHTLLTWEFILSFFTFLCFQSLCRVPFLIMSWERGLFSSMSAIPDLWFPCLYWAGGVVSRGTLEGFLSYFLCCYNSCVELDHEKS